MFYVKILNKKIGITPGLVRMSCGTEPGLANAVRETLEEMELKSITFYEIDTSPYARQNTSELKIT